MKKILLFMLVLMYSNCLFGQKPIKLFKENDKQGWYAFLAKTGKNNDPLNVFRFEKGVIHASGEDFGYLITTEKFSDFHFTIQFKWGTKKYLPRLNDKRDAGVLYHADIYSIDKIWPRSLEFQVQEGDCGDFWMTDSTTIRYKGVLTEPKNGLNIKKERDAEKPNGQWNTVEVIVQNNHITHKINGVTVVEAMLGNTKEGHIVIQSEGAEVFYRKAKIKRL